MTAMFILCLCACAVLTSATLYNQRIFNQYPGYGFNNYNPQGYYNFFQSGYPGGMWGSGGRGHHSRYRRAIYGQPRFPYQRFNRYGGQFNQFGYQPWFGNNGYRQFW